MGVRDIFLVRLDHRLGFRLNRVSDWLRVSTNHHQFEYPSKNKCTNKYRFGRVAWKGQFLVNKPINNNQCSYGQPGTYSHIQERYKKPFQVISILSYRSRIDFGGSFLFLLTNIIIIVTNNCLLKFQKHLLIST